ncbi:hypothetical protein HanIR_Chr03g0145391 [Helianthus annuus]|nr:hypothetical protein HanIR_Chr03g0145391 [Helianthus annuus]
MFDEDDEQDTDAQSILKFLTNIFLGRPLEKRDMINSKVIKEVVSALGRPLADVFLH